MAAIARLRARVRRGHQLVGQRLGIGLGLCSVIHDVTLTAVLSTDAGGVLCTSMTAALSVSSVLLHIAMAVAYDDLHPLCGAHYAVHAMETFIWGVVGLVKGDAWWWYYIFVWGLCLYPIGAWGLHRLLSAASKFDASTKDAVSQSAILAFVSCSTPLAYLTLNGLLCVGFSNNPGQYCGIRVAVNYSTILALMANAIVFVLLTVQPVSLVQVTHLDVPQAQMVAFGFHGALLLTALTLHSQNETFGPTTPIVSLMSRISTPCLALSLIAFAISLRTFMANETHQTTAADGSALDKQDDAEMATDDASPPGAATTESAGATHYGAMVPHRFIMILFTICYLTLEICNVGSMIRYAFAPLSFAAVCFHVWITMESATVGRVVVIHFFAHAASAVVIGIRALYDAKLSQAIAMLLYVAIL